MKKLIYTITISLSLTFLVGCSTTKIQSIDYLHIQTSLNKLQKYIQNCSQRDKLTNKTILNDARTSLEKYKPETYDIECGNLK